MTQSIFQSDSCSRREFVLASGIVVASSLISCTSVEDQPAQYALQPPAPEPHNPVLMRVRIGRGVQTVSIGKTKISRIRGTWRGTSTPNEQAVEIETKANTVIQIAEQTKKYQAQLHCTHKTTRQTVLLMLLFTFQSNSICPGFLRGNYLHTGIRRPLLHKRLPQEAMQQTTI